MRLRAPNRIYRNHFISSFITAFYYDLLASGIIHIFYVNVCEKTEQPEGTSIGGSINGDRIPWTHL